ncbi:MULTISPECIES: hypothetical protein [Burkholderia cepacia complex]|nr:MULTISPECIES: hypothetical protein [Burkholderia cepacia complex]
MSTIVLVVASAVSGSTSGQTVSRASNEHQSASASGSGVAANVIGSHNTINVSTMDAAVLATLKSRMRIEARMLAELRNAVASIRAMAQTPATAPAAKQSLAALKAGNLTPSVALLHDREIAVAKRAEESTVSTADARHQAAELARQQGALAFFSDTEGALGAYQRAAEYVPDDPETLIFIGDLQDTLGQTRQALATFDQARAVLERKLALSPDSAALQRALAVTHDRMGVEIRKQGDLGGALTHFRQALALFEKLVQRDPGNKDWQRDLAIAHDSIGVALELEGNVADSLVQFRQMMAIIEPLARREPGDVGLQLDLIFAHIRIGDSLITQGGVTDAMSSYHQAAALLKALDRRGLSDAAKPHNLSLVTITADEARYSTHVSLGNVLLTTGDYEGSLAEYQIALNVAQTRAQRDPNNVDWQKLALFAHLHHADALAARGNYAAALAEERQAQTLAKSLSSREPDHRYLQRSVAATHANIAAWSVMLKDSSGAVNEARLGIEQLTELAQNDPKNKMWQSELASGHLFLSAALMGLNDLPGALAESQKAIEIDEALTHDDVANVAWQVDLAQSHEMRAGFFMARQNFAGAASEARTGAEILEPIAKRDPENAFVQTLLAGAYFMLSRTSTTSDDRHNFRERSIAILTKLKDDGKLMSAAAVMLSVAQADAQAEGNAPSHSSR